MTAFRLKTQGAFQKSEVTGWIMAGPVIFDNKIGFFQESLMKTHLFRAYYLRFDRSGLIVLIKNEILIATGMVWPVSSDNSNKARPQIPYVLDKRSQCQIRKLL